MASLTIENLARSFPCKRGGSPVRALRGLTLEVKDGELLAVVGPSGCGKTTLLRLMAGLETPDAGGIAIDGMPAASLAPEDRNVAMVFQNHALYPHLTARENLACGLKWRGAKAEEIEIRVAEMARVMNLEGCLDRLPEHLSGGQCQRVALGRAAVLRPRLFLFDEPLAHLDAEMRLQLRREIRAWNRSSGAPVIHVTHDQAEALAMGDRVAVLNDGALQQIDKPEVIYERPANRFVAGFIGSPPMNLVEGELIRENEALLFCENRSEGDSRDGSLRFPLDGRATAALGGHSGKPVILGLRPEALDPIEEGELPIGDAAISDKVRFVEYSGDGRCLTLHSGLTVKAEGRNSFDEGQKVTIRIDSARACFFDPKTKQAIV